MADGNLILYLNLAGELFYIVGHRMTCQHVKPDLQSRVYNDLGLAICNLEVIQRLISGRLRILRYKMPQMKTLMDHIVHASIMSINDYSMEKLFELTLISTKYQFTLCQHPKDILLIALNHLDSIRNCLTDTNVIQLAENVHRVLAEFYGQQPTCAMRDYLHQIRNYVQDINLKMTNLINLKLQLPDGSFVISSNISSVHPECSMPGTIKYGSSHPSLEFSTKIETFVDENLWHHRQNVQFSELDGNRVIRLGLNLYDGNYSSELLADSSSEVLEGSALLRGSESREVFATRKAVQGLDLCSILLGCEDAVHLPSPSTTATSSKIGYSPAFSAMLEKSPEISKPLKKEAPADKLNTYYSRDVNVIQIDGRYNRSASKTALSAIARDLDKDN